MNMAYWYHPPTGQKFVAHDAIRKAFQWNLYPAVITDEDLAWTGVYVVQATEPPADVPDGQVAIDDEPQLVDGAWVQTWVIVDAPPAGPEEAGQPE